MPSFKEKLGLYAAKANEIIGKASEYAKVAAALGPKPSLINYVGAAVQLIDQGTKDLTDSTLGIKNIGDLEFISDRISVGTSKFVLSKGKIVGGIPKDGDHIVEAHGMTFVVSKEGGDLRIPKTQCEFKSRASIARLLWENSNGTLHLYRANDPYYINLEPMTDFAMAPSERATEIQNHIAGYLERGKNRSLFIHGVPGTGKTTLANTICKNLCERILFIDARGVDNHCIINAIRDLSPDGVILNEIDKGEMESHLEALESLSRNVKVMIATSNRVNDVPATVLRPGRFSDIIHIDKLDDATIDRVMGFECPDEMRQEIKSWPIAFISELNNRMEVGLGTIDEHFSEMKRRVGKLREVENGKNSYEE